MPLILYSGTLLSAKLNSNPFPFNCFSVICYWLSWIPTRLGKLDPTASTLGEKNSLKQAAQLHHEALTNDYNYRKDDTQVANIFTPDYSKLSLIS